MYGSHHQQPQNHGQNDVLDPFLVVKEPSMMHAIHGQHSYRPDPTEDIITEPELVLLRVRTPTPVDRVLAVPQNNNGNGKDSATG
jgi:hypothetical protein